MNGRTFLLELDVMKMQLSLSFLIILEIYLNYVFGHLIGDKPWVELVMVSFQMLNYNLLHQC